MKKVKTRMFFSLVAIFIALISSSLSAQLMNIVPTNSSQADIMKTYKLAAISANNDYHSTSANFDTNLFPLWGEHSVYWINSGSNAGAFILPDEIPGEFSSVSKSTITNYDWQANNHYSLQFKANSKSIAIFESLFEISGASINWESAYFQNIINSYLMQNAQYVCNEEQIISNGFSKDTKLLIVPAFSQAGGNNKTYIDSVFLEYPGITAKINAFLASGGTIYTEGNAAYFAEKLGYLSEGAINFNDLYTSANNSANITFESNSAPFSYCIENTSTYVSEIPMVTIADQNIIARLNTDNRPFYFQLNNANGGRILCNLALPTVGGYLNLKSGSKQLQWTFNAIFSAFISKIDVTRSVFNKIPTQANMGNNSISYDAVDTFEVHVKIRNVSNTSLSGININEEVREYFSFVDVTTNQGNFSQNGNTLEFSNISLGANSEIEIVYRLSTPETGTGMHERVDEFLDVASLMHASKGDCSYADNQGINHFYKNKNYADIMFSARLVADADVNWKNFLGLEYQAFKVFMNMENKERTSAVETEYIQYIPKDVPFYWSDNSLNIPILKTPGGKFVDVLKGSNIESAPDYDMDSDGKPDVWLDTASIYPKGYTIVEEEVYWQNPWAHLSGAAQAVFEDIDHDGLVAQDTDGDGIVDVEEPGDKIRVWKVTWDIGSVPGYQYYEPYCYYELWIDPPQLVDLSKGAGFAHGTIPQDANMFYPYTTDITSADISDTTWSHWMERDGSGNVTWKNLILQSIGNYEGFAYVDPVTYQMKPTDQLVGLVPQPHQEFLAVVSLGGEEIDMTHWTPTNSLYSKINYKTVFGEEKVTPIRTTYTYWAPLPNPLQFEYLGNNFVITDPVSSNTLKILPKYGDANITFELDASTEYTYYWIRNVGYDVDYNDASEAIEGLEGLGDGVFGYFVYEIPKGMGGYSMDLPRKTDGTFDVDAIVKIDGQSFAKWIDNPNTLNNVEIWENDFSYLVYVPQLLIPPALDDDNHDGIDDWIDDRGDRFSSSTGFLHDAFMLSDGESYPVGSPNVYTHDDDIYGTVTEGWSAGADNTYGDDYFEKLGKTHITVHAKYTGDGREGPVDIAKGGTLVVEEIFGGSPWVIFSHVLTGFAEGVDYQINSELDPKIVGFGKDTVIVKHTIESLDEPHDFDHNFEPFSTSYGTGKEMATATIGGKDPCSLVDPDTEFHSIIDIDYEHVNLTLVPLADGSNPDLTGYPKNVSGTYTIIKVEVNNGTEQNWVNTSITPHFGSESGNTEVIMSYVAYPRPLVPSTYTGSGLVPGDDIGTFRAGWRFNQPEGEVLVKMGNTLNLLQPSRKAYFIYLVKLDDNHDKGVFEVIFTLSGNKLSYDGSFDAPLNFAIPPVKYSVTDKNSAGQAVNYQQFIIGTGELQNIDVAATNLMNGTSNVKWSLDDVSSADFDILMQTLPSNGNSVDLSQFKNFPGIDTSKIIVLQQFETTISKSTDTLASTAENLNFLYQNKTNTVSDSALVFMPLGPMIKVEKTVVAVNGQPYNGSPVTISDVQIILDVAVNVINYGNDIAQEVAIDLYDTDNYSIVASSLPTFCNYSEGVVNCTLGTILPGQSKQFIIQYQITDAEESNNITIVLDEINSLFKGTFVENDFDVVDEEPLLFSAYDFKIIDLTYEQTDADKITIHTIAVNRGINAADVMIRVYPVIDGQQQDVIAETIVHDLGNTQTAQLSSEYNFGNSNGEITLVAFIDPLNEYIELFENNNSKELKFNVTDIEQIINSKNNINVFPNPTKDMITFSYDVSQTPKEVIVKIYNINGVEIDKIESGKKGISGNTINYNSANLASGKYIYKISIDYGNQKVSYNGIMVKE